MAQKTALCGWCGLPHTFDDQLERLPYHSACAEKLAKRIHEELGEAALMTYSQTLAPFSMKEINDIMSRVRIRGFRPALTPASNMLNYMQAVKDEARQYREEVRIYGTETVRQKISNDLAAHMAKVNPNKEKDNTIMADTKNTPIQTTGGMLKDALIEGGLNAACKKTNQTASDLLAGLLRDKGIVVADTPEGKLFLQTTAPALLHFLCTTFSEHIPGASKAIPLLARAENMAVTDVMIVAGDKLIDTLLPMVKEAVSNVNNIVEKLPEAAAKKLREEDEMRMRVIVQQQQEAAGKTL